MHFSLIIPVFQTPGILNIFLESLITTLEYPTQIIFYNDGSGYKIKSILSEFGKKLGKQHEAIIFENAYSKGCVYCINQALDKTTGFFTVLLDSDTILTYGWQKKVVQFFDSNSNAGAVCPLLLFPQNNSIQCAGIIFSECMARRKYFLKKYNAEEFTQPYEVQSGVFAFCAIRSTIIKKVGHLDSNFFNGYEDIDYQLRIGEAGYKIFVNPQIVIYHWEKSNGIHRLYNKRNNTASLWKKHDLFIKHDLWNCIKTQLDLLVADSSLIPVDLCESRVDGLYFFSHIIPSYNISHTLDYSYCVSAEQTIWLPEILPSDSCFVHDRYLFLCDTFIELLDNSYWYERRKKYREDDLIVDLQGNVMIFNELSSGFWPGKSIRF